MKYKIVKASSTEPLEVKVNEMLVCGWELNGGITTEETPAGRVYCQAMTREDRHYGEADFEGNIFFRVLT